MDFRREFIRLQFTQARDAFDEYTVRTKFQIHIYLFIQIVKASIHLKCTNIMYNSSTISWSWFNLNIFVILHLNV